MSRVQLSPETLRRALHARELTSRVHDPDWVQQGRAGEGDHQLEVVLAEDRDELVCAVYGRIGNARLITSLPALLTAAAAEALGDRRGTPTPGIVELAASALIGVSALPWRLAGAVDLAVTGTGYQDWDGKLSVVSAENRTIAETEVDSMEAVCRMQLIADGPALLAELLRAGLLREAPEAPNPHDPPPSAWMPPPVREPVDPATYLGRK